MTTPKTSRPSIGRLLAGLGLFAGLCAAPPLTAQPGMLYILDASGSMWGRIGGEPKISAAKRVLGELISQTPDHLSIDLMAYGHRRKGDCTDIELIAAGGDRAIVQQHIAGIHPKGRTPISEALIQASQALSGREDETSLVLVSDGLETCAGDPCAVARQLREQNQKLTVHAVGLDVGRKAADQLRCIADAGGGRYFPARDADALQQALSRVKQAVSEAKPIPPAPDQPKVEAAGATSKRIRIAGPGKVRIVPAPWVEMPPKYWALREAESGEDRGRGHGDKTRVKAGEYQIVWRQSEHGHSEVPLTAVATVHPGKTTEVALDTGLRLTVPQGVQAPRWWALAPAEDARPLFYVNRSLAPQLMPAGDYRLLWRQQEHGARTVDLGPVHIQAGRLNDRVLDHGILLQTADWMSNPKPYYYRLLDARGEIAGSWRGMGPQLAPPGDYTLVYRPSQHRHADIHWGAVTIPAHGMARVALDSGIRFIHDKGAKPPHGVYLVNLDTQREISMSNTWEPLPLPPGRYRMDWWELQHGSRRETLVDEIQVESGMLLEMEI